jgi:hypothetical protein
MRPFFARQGDGATKEGHGKIPLNVHLGYIMIMNAHLEVF